MILADTDVLIDYLAGADAVVPKVVAYVSVDQLQTSAVSCFELLSGASKGKRGDRIRRLLALLPILPLDRNAAERAAMVRQQLEQKGRAIGMADSLIAGIALTNGLTLFTRNRKHFGRVENLQLVDIDEAT